MPSVELEPVSCVVHVEFSSPLVDAPCRFRASQSREGCALVAGPMEVKV